MEHRNEDDILAEELLELFDEGDALAKDYEAAKQGMAGVLNDQAVLSKGDDLIELLKADLAEDSVESLLRAKVRLAEAVEARIKQKLGHD